MLTTQTKTSGLKRDFNSPVDLFESRLKAAPGEARIDALNVSMPPPSHKPTNNFQEDLQNNNHNSLIRSRMPQINSSADKPFVSDPGVEKTFSMDNSPDWVKIIPKIDAVANWSAFSANIANFFLQLLSISDDAKKKITNVVDFITNLSFIPYGLDGMRKGIKKRNPFQTLGFFLEMTNVWFSNLKTKYLVRGLATGTDQIWVATDTKLAHKYKDGNMLKWKNGFTDVPLACWDLLKEIWRDPVGTLATIKSKGHHAVLSTMGDIVATLGYAITGKENIFGPVRDLAGGLFDWELLLRDKVVQKCSGLFFILESGFDFLARFMDTNSMRIAVNSLSHACGRLALSLYKASDPN